MKIIGDFVRETLIENGLVMSFLLIGILMWISGLISKKITKGRIHPSAIAILFGLLIAYAGGRITGGSKGIADIAIFSGVGILGSNMLRDFTIIATALGADLKKVKECGPVGVIALFVGVTTSFLAGTIIAVLFGYTDPKSITVIAAGAVSFIVGPVTAASVGVSSELVAISIAAGVIKSMAIMIGTPFIAKFIGLDNPKTAMIYGAMMGSTSGTAAGLAATDKALVPYGAMMATFYMGLGCLLCPTVLYGLITLIF